MTKEELKQEAEEYTDKEFGMYQPTDHERYLRCQSFQDGATFGYNKANEWHYVKDGKPKDNEFVLIYTNLKNIYVGRIPTERDYFIVGRGMFVPISTVIAWCELPEPPKEEE